jgi:hypothetical protein
MPPFNRDSGAGAPRRLEDVSHFFLDADRPESRNSLKRERTSGQPRIVHLASVADRVPGAMIVAGLAALSVQSGMRVLVAEAFEHPFDVAFALGVSRAELVHQRPIAEARSGVGVLAAPLVGSTLPSFYLQPDDLRAVQDRLRGADLVFVHPGCGEVERVQPEIAFPDELVVVVPEASLDGQLDAYRAIKGVIRWNPEVRIGVIAAGASPALGRPLSRLTEAVEGFLRRDCSVIGRISDASTLVAHFLSGAFLDAGREEIARVLGPIASRWMRQTGPQESKRSPSAAINLDGLTAAAHPSGLVGAFSPPRRRMGIQDGLDPSAGNPSPSRGRGPAPA